MMSYTVLVSQEFRFKRRVLSAVDIEANPEHPHEALIWAQTCESQSSPVGEKGGMRALGDRACIVNMVLA